jgi:RsmE family RNA methyltransferase
MSVVDLQSRFDGYSADTNKRRGKIDKRRIFSAITTTSAFSWMVVMSMSMSSRFCGVASLSFGRDVSFIRPTGNQHRKYHGTTICRLNRFLFSPEEATTTTTTMEDERLSDAPNNNTGTITTTTTSVIILPKDDYRTVHAAKILGLRNGDFIRAGLVGNSESSGGVGQWTDEATIEWLPESPVKKAEVLKNGNPPGSLSIRLNNLKSIDDDDSRPSAASDPIHVSLILALPRPLQLGRILPMISQIGVDHLVLTSAKKVPKDYFGSHLFRKPEILREKLIEGLCQAGDVRLPKLHVVKNLRHFLLSEDFDALFPKESYARVLTHPKRHDDPDEPLRMSEVKFPTNSPPRIVVAIGPEGGWEEPGELDMFKKDCCFQQITLGSRTLRSDVAVAGLLSLAHEACHANKGNS